VVTYWRLKTKENFKLLALKVLAIVYKRWLLKRGYKILQRFDLETFGILENRPLRRCSGKGRFNCISQFMESTQSTTIVL